MKLSKKNTETLNKYYASVNQGNFMAVTECLSEDVVFSIPGNPELLPFSGDFKGKEEVLKLFERFGNAFWIVGMSETRTITTENEVFSFNDEAFKVKSNGQYYRVPVMHKMKFNDEGLIELLTNIHDTYVAELAFSNKTAIVEPILTGDLVSGEEELDEKIAISRVKQFLEKLEKNESIDELLSDNSSVISPGDPSILNFSGIYVGKDQVLNFIKEKQNSVNVKEFNIKQMIANNGSVVVYIEEKGSMNNKNVSLVWAALIQVNKDEKIEKINIYMDTAALSKVV